MPDDLPVAEIERLVVLERLKQFSGNRTRTRPVSAFRAAPC